MQQIAPVWPSYHLDMLALAAVGMNKGPLTGHVLVLAGVAIGFLLLAARRLRRHG
jgi:ABC-2 type transport system permease protein